MEITDLIGKIPYRMALAGGWIDQPFVSQLNPTPPGSMVVVGLEPIQRFMDRSGMATSTRRVAMELWDGRLPGGNPAEIVRILYDAENRGKAEPSGAQDMAGLVYPGISRLDFDAQFEEGYFPAHIETSVEAQVAAWLEDVFYLIPVNQRAPGYNPLGIKNLDTEWIRRLGQSGKDCYAAILAQDLKGLGQSMNETMLCWEKILPQTVRHDTISVDLMGLLCYYQAHFSGAMYSGCGGGYLFVVSERPVPGGFKIKIRLK